MNSECVKSFLTYYLQSLTERTRREKTGTKWGFDWVIYNIGLERYGKPVRLPFLRSGGSGFPKSKVEAEFGVDLAFLSEDTRTLSIFVLKDEPLTNSNWTGNDFDRDLRMAMAPDLGMQGLENLKKVTIILAYNKDDQQNGVEAYDRLVSSVPATLRGDIALEFSRWNLSDLVDLTLKHVLSPSLLPERFFGQLTYIAAQAADFPHGSEGWEQQLRPNWEQFLNDVLGESPGVRGVLLIPIALIIIRNQAESNPSIETGWIDLVESAAIALWKIYSRQRKPEITVAVQRFWRDLYIAELDRFYAVHIDALTTEQAIDQTCSSSLIGAIASAYIAYWHLGRLGILGISKDEIIDTKEDRGKAVQRLANWIARMINATPAALRPLLDIHHIQIFLVVEIFRRSERLNDIANLFTVLVERLYLRRMGDGEIPFLDGNNSLENVLEQVAVKPKEPLLLTTSSFLVLMLLELCFLLPAPARDQIIRTIHSRLVLGVADAGPVGDRKSLDLMSWAPPDNWAELVFESSPEGGHSVAVQPFAESRESPTSELIDGVRNLVSTMRGASSPLQFPTDVPLGALMLACLRYNKPVPPEIWRRTAFTDGSI